MKTEMEYHNHINYSDTTWFNFKIEKNNLIFYSPDDFRTLTNKFNISKDGKYLTIEFDFNFVEIISNTIGKLVKLD